MVAFGIHHGTAAVGLRLSGNAHDWHRGQGYPFDGHRPGDERREDRPPSAPHRSARPCNRIREVPPIQGRTAFHPTYQVRDDDIELMIVAVVTWAVCLWSDDVGIRSEGELVPDVPSRREESWLYQTV